MDFVKLGHKQKQWFFLTEGGDAYKIEFIAIILKTISVILEVYCQ